MTADGYGNPGLSDDGFVVTCHIERWSVFVVSVTIDGSDEDAADAMVNHDGCEIELAASFVVTFVSSANGVVGTVAGTVMVTLLYNSGEATVVVAYSISYLDVIVEDSTCPAFGFDSLGGGMTTGSDGACEVHSIGCGLPCTCVLIVTE